MVSIGELEDIRRGEIPARPPAGEIIISSLDPSQISNNVMLKASKADSTGSVLSMFKYSWHLAGKPW